MLNSAASSPRPMPSHTANGERTAEAATGARPVRWESWYLSVLTWTFSLFNLARLVSYLPTLWAICRSGESGQHSLWTWGIWLGANLTMALWLHEQQGRRWTRATLINLVNAAMCATTMVVIVIFRL